MSKKLFLLLNLLLWTAANLLAAGAATSRSESDFPAGTFNSLTEQQKKDVLAVTNQKICNCGCKNGTIANCTIEDPKCSVSRNLLSQTIALAKQGKSVTQISKEIDSLLASRKPAAKPPPVTMVAYREDDPYEGTRFAKVTIIEFSDFQ